MRIVSTNGGDDGSNDPRDRFWWSRRFNVIWRKTAESFIEAGRILLDAKEGENRLPHGEFLKMVEEDLACSPRTAQRLMEIARHPVLSNTAHGSHLPPSWRTQSELASLPPEIVEAKIKDGTINPKMQRKDAFGLRPGGAVKAKQGMTQLDRFKDKIAEKDGEIADLEERLTAAESDANDLQTVPLLDIFERESPEDIANMIITEVGEYKAKQIAAAITKRLEKPKGRRPKSDAI
jgi:hypothetical protein